MSLWKKTRMRRWLILLDNQDKASFPLVEEVEKESLDILLQGMEEEGAEFASQDEDIFNQF